MQRFIKKYVTFIGPYADLMSVIIADTRISLFCIGDTVNSCSDILARNVGSWSIVQISNFATSVIVLAAIKIEMESLVSHRPP
jgi:hypothetical protein